MERKNWPKLIAEIESAGISTFKLSLMMHRQFGMIQRWKNGQEPKHYEGEMLLMIHRENVPHETFENKPSE